MRRCVVIAGGGHGGFQAAASLRQEGFDGRIVIVDEEGELPYQRPPLSKAYLASEVGRDTLAFRPAAFYAKSDIELIADAAVEIDRGGRTVRLAKGASLAYDHLILAVGARTRKFPVPGADLDGVLSLRSLADSDRLRQRLEAGRRLVVVGAGFIGLEVAASAAKLGLTVTVVELADRVMGRAVLPPISQFFAGEHTANGVRLLVGTAIERLIGGDGGVAAVELTDGRRFEADVVLVAIGVEPNAELAGAAGLPVANGIVVDDSLRTADPHVSAVGDCVAFRFAATGDMVRLESVQNAVDQARCVAARLTGKPHAYDAVPWFWSDQGDLHLQMAGLNRGVDRIVEVGSREARSFSVLGFRSGRLAAVESVNRAGDHMAARRLFGLKATISLEAAELSGFDLKAHLRQAAQAS